MDVLIDAIRAHSGNTDLEEHFIDFTRVYFQIAEVREIDCIVLKCSASISFVTDIMSHPLRDSITSAG